MRIDRLRINQLSPNTHIRYLTYLQAVDIKNVKVYGTFLADDCVMQSNNEPPVPGKAAILQGLSYYWNTFDSLTHDLLNIYGTDSSFVLEALNHYKRNDGKVVAVGGSSYHRPQRSRISDFYQTLQGYNTPLRIDRSLTLHHNWVTNPQHYPHTSSYDLSRSSTRPTEGRRNYHRILLKY